MCSDSFVIWVLALIFEPFPERLTSGSQPAYSSSLFTSSCQGLNLPTLWGELRNWVGGGWSYKTRERCFCHWHERGLVPVSVKNAQAWVHRISYAREPLIVGVKTMRTCDEDLIKISDPTGRFMLKLTNDSDFEVLLKILASACDLIFPLSYRDLNNFPK